SPVLYWSAPTAGGPVYQYHIAWDTAMNGAFNNGFDITDPAATSYAIVDDGVFDVSQIRYYRLTAVNENGPSLPSSAYSLTPKNATDPQAPTALAASVGQTNQITLSWVAPTLNDPAHQTLTCTGTGGSTDGSAIPNGETLKYEIWRGINSNFDPNTALPTIER